MVIHGLPFTMSGLRLEIRARDLPLFSCGKSSTTDSQLRGSSHSYREQPGRPHGRFDYAYVAGSGVTLLVRFRIFKSSPSRITVQKPLMSLRPQPLP